MTVTAVANLNEFREIISNGRVSAFDFWAEWCNPCRAISPHFEQLSEEIKNIDFYKVDVEAAQDVARELDIRAMPTFIVFKDGKEAGKTVGAIPPQLTALIKSHAA